MKSVIKGKIGWCIGFSLENKKENECGSIMIRRIGQYLLNHDLCDPQAKYVKQNIDNYLTKYVFPIFDSHPISKRLSRKTIKSIRIEMFNNILKNTISFNESSKILFIADLINPLKTNDETILPENIEKIKYIFVENKDPNSAIMLFELIGEEWYGCYNLIFNAEIIRQKYDAANEFMKSAKCNLDKSRMIAFYNDLWSSYELLVESISLSFPNPKRLKHDEILKKCKEFCEQSNLPYYNNYEKIYEIRNEVRYGRSSKYSLTESAYDHFNSLENFSKMIEIMLNIDISPKMGLRISSTRLHN